jgi:putative hemolysin
VASNEKVQFSIIKSDDNNFVKSIKRRVEQFMCLPRLYSEVVELYDDPDILSSDLLTSQKLELEIIGQKYLENLDACPTIIVFNHPHGLMDGQFLGFLLKKIVKIEKFKFIANEIVPEIFPSLGKHIIPVDNMSEVSSKRSFRNSRSLIKVIKYLKEKNTVLIAPAGEVSEFKIFSSEGVFSVTDCSWNSSFISVLVKSKARVIPIHISGSNSLSYQLSSFLGSTMKRILNFREFLNCRSKKVTLTIRKPIDYNEGFETRPKNEISEEIRQYLYSGSL